VSYCPGFFESREADVFLKNLIDDVPWSQDAIKIFGRSMGESIKDLPVKDLESFKTLRIVFKLNFVSEGVLVPIWMIKQ